MTAWPVQAEHKRRGTLPAMRTPEELHTNAPLVGVMAAILGAVGYNAALAWLGARGMVVSMPYVIAAEVLVLALTLALVLIAGRRQTDNWAVLLLIFFGFTSLLTSILAEQLFPDMVRNVLIIALFFMLGTRCDVRTLRVCFTAAAAVVGTGLLLEALSTPTYVSLFAPAQYYDLTRGSEPLETVDGLYRNASGFESRFVIIELLGHRASSIFLEPVSLGNFGVILLGYMVATWERISVKERTLFIVLVLAILSTSNSRILLGFVLLAPLIYLCGPFLRPAHRLLIMPATLLLAVIIYAQGSGLQKDNLVGRIEKAVGNLGELGAPGLFGGRAVMANEFSDSGYAYVIAASSFIGLAVLWLTSALLLRQSSKMQSRAGLFLALYVALNLLVSGTSLFSIKAAALLWLLVGCARCLAEPTMSPATPAQENSSKLSWRAA